MIRRIRRIPLPVPNWTSPVRESGPRPCHAHPCHLHCHRAARDFDTFAPTRTECPETTAVYGGERLGNSRKQKPIVPVQHNVSCVCVCVEEGKGRGGGTVCIVPETLVPYGMKRSRWRSPVRHRNLTVLRRTRSRARTTHRETSLGLHRLRQTAGPFAKQRLYAARRAACLG